MRQDLQQSDNLQRPAATQFRWDNHHGQLGITIKGSLVRTGQLNSCFKCNEKGHKANRCPNQRVLRLCNGVWEDVVEEESGDDQPEAITAFPDEGEPLNLFLHKTLLSPREDEDCNLFNLFKTRGTVAGKIVNIIIDNGSTENLISRKVAEAL